MELPTAPDGRRGLRQVLLSKGRGEGVRIPQYRSSPSRLSPVTPSFRVGVVREERLMPSDFTWMRYVIAWLPVLIIIIGMVAFTMSAVRTGLAAWIVGSILALLFFGFDAGAITLATAKGILQAFDIMVIIGGALFLYFVVETSGAIDKIKWSIICMTNDRTMQVPVIAVGFSGFLHGIAGFGVPPAVTAPILMALGFSAMDACVLTLIGYSSYMVWGTWGVGPTTGATLTKIPIQS